MRITIHSNTYISLWVHNLISVPTLLVVLKDDQFQLCTCCNKCIKSHDKLVEDKSITCSHQGTTGPYACTLGGIFHLPHSLVLGVNEKCGLSLHVGCRA